MWTKAPVLIYILENSLRLNSVLPTNVGKQDTRQDTSGVKSAAAVAKWRILASAKASWTKPKSQIFAPHTVRGGIVGFEYENSSKTKTLSFWKYLCFVRLNGHLVSLCLDDAVCTKREKMLLYFRGMLQGWKCITNWDIIVMGIGKVPPYLNTDIKCCQNRT